MSKLKMLDKIIVCGKNGQVASALRTILGNSAIYLDRAEVDQLSDYQKLGKKFDGINPTAIINAAAYTDVDKAEEEKESAYKINAVIPANIAKYCAEKNIPFVSYSTDYVFGNEETTAHTEEDQTNPLNAYGKTKLEGEKKISEIGGKYLIFRTSWVYDSHRANFLTTMTRLAKNREELNIVSDQIGAPTYAPDLAKATIDALKNTQEMEVFPSGIYHLCNKGETNWYDYALAIFSIARKQNIKLKIKTVKPIPTSKYPTPAKRPLNSRLNCSKAESVLKIKMPNWKKSLGIAIEDM